MNDKALLFLHSLTGMHPGSGTALGTVDLPVQRERHTQWPIIPGSAMKGVLRDAARQSITNPSEAKGLKEADSDTLVTTLFGPPTSNADSHAGAMAFTDARLLAYPVRSINGIFAWVTCPAALMRLKRDLELIGQKSTWELPELGADGGQSNESVPILTSNNSPLLVSLPGGKSSVVLEEFEFRRKGDSSHYANWIADNAVRDDDTKARMKTHLVVIPDDNFDYFVRYATEILARIGLDYERKTVREGALFYQEFLPADCIFYSIVLVTDSRNNADNRSKTELLKEFSEELLPSVLQVGGDETIGKGICNTRLLQNGGGN